MGRILQSKSRKGSSENKLIFFLIGFLFAACLISLILWSGDFKLFECNNECNCECNVVCPNPSLEIDDWTFTREFSERFEANQNYEVNFNCINYSVIYNYCAEQLGIDSKLKAGRKLDLSGHMWNQICIDIEPQNAKFIDYANKYPMSIPEKQINRYESEWESIIQDTAQE